MPLEHSQVTEVLIRYLMADRLRRGEQARLLRAARESRRRRPERAGRS